MFREHERIGGGPARSEVERLCRYITNDSLIRWHLGCSQEEIDRTRARLAKARTPGFAYLPPSHAGCDESSEERLRAKRAAAANERYLAAVRRAHG